MDRMTIVLGGGAAGFFAAIHAASNNQQVLLLEKTNQLLSKVRISGGGRCNVTHACFEPASLVKNYPRGSKELLGPFSRFQPRDTVEWFQQRGVLLKTEGDGRIFPQSNTSQTIIDCLMTEAKKVGVEIKVQQKIESIERAENGFYVATAHEKYFCSKLIVATGSHPSGYQFAKQFGHTIIDPVPSLFTFNVPTSSLKELSGVSVPLARVQIRGTNLEQTGPLLITHFGFSGPAILKLSAFGARFLQACDYKAEIVIRWVEEAEKQLLEQKEKTPQAMLSTSHPFLLPRSLWKHFTHSMDKKWKDVSHKEIKRLSEKLSSDVYPIDGKTTHKEEFVTAGGIALKEVNFKTMESKCCPHLYCAGEILDIDGITGGFNFQNAWTTGFLAGGGGI